MAKDAPAAGKPDRPPAWHNAAPDWHREARAHLWLPYAQMRTAPDPLPAVSAEGVRIRLSDGRELLDGVASWWTACHGYNHPHIVAAVEAQNRALQHVMLGGLVHEGAARLAVRLARLLPGDLDHVFFSESGSVAVEVALKMALQYWSNRGVEGRNRFLCFEGAYHGDTLAAMAVTDPRNPFHAPFRGAMPEALVAKLPATPSERAAFDDLVQRHRSELAAIVVEPLAQGGGGMRFHAPETLASVAATARRHGVLLIADEIFTGFGRTGSMFASEQAEIVPDILCLGKALAGGATPMAATVATRAVYDAFLSDDPAKGFMHGPTFMANPLACAAANASLDLFEREPRLAQVAAIQSQLAEELGPCEGLPGVAQVRVKGAIGAVQMKERVDGAGLSRRFEAEGLFLRPFGDVIYLTPAFVIESGDLSALAGAIRRALSVQA